MTAAVHISDAIDLITAERSSLIVLGRAISPAEQRRLSDLERSVTLLVEALNLLEAGVTHPLDPAVALGGRYGGRTDEVVLDLRVDPELGVISGDLSAVTSQPGSSEPIVGYAASFRTAPGQRFGAIGNVRHVMVAEDDLGELTTGTVELTAVGDGLTCTLFLESGLNGLPGARSLAVPVDRESDLLRRLGLEIDREDGVVPIGPVGDGAEQRTLDSVITAAGLEPVVATTDLTIPAKADGWDTAELHALMVDVAERPVDRRAWELGLLVLGRANARYEGLLGVMFDTTPTLPRQAAAVFASTVRDLRPLDADRKLLQTTVHELGHALNLAHRFEREVGRADSFSHMAYDWRHVNGPTAFWEGYEYRFDADELEFMRHGRRQTVIPGGDAFHSVRYWADGDGGYSPYVPEVPLTGLSLRLEAPPASLAPGGPMFLFGQPVFLRVSLRNNLSNALEIAPQILDHKVGLLEVLIRRHRPGDPSGLLDAEPFVPIAQRCVDIDPGAADVVPPGGELHNNLNLTFGASGFGFAEPGQYDVTALLVVPEIEDRQVVREYVVASPPLRINVAHPTTVGENESAAELLDPEIGAWFALGGSPALPKAGDRLAELAQRRGDDASSDPIVAAIVRTQAFDALRTPVRFDRASKTFTTGTADPEMVETCVRQLDADALRHFDASTAASMRRLADDIEA